MAESDPLAVPDGLADGAIDDLYARPLGEFTGARNALAKELRADGKTGAADWVKSLAKPTAAAWTVNQLVRLEGSQMSELRDVGTDLARLQEDLLRGKADRRRLQAVQHRERELLAELAAAARGVSSGAAASLIDKVRDTLHAAGLDPRVRDLIAVGRLSREQVAVGLGPMVVREASESGAAVSRRTRPKKSKRTSALKGKLKQATAKQREGRRKLEAATAAATRARRALQTAERRAQSATAAVEKAAAAQATADARVAELEAEISKAE